MGGIVTHNDACNTRLCAFQSQEKKVTDWYFRPGGKISLFL